MSRAGFAAGSLAALLLALLAGCGQNPAPVPAQPVRVDFKAGQKLYVRASALNMRQCPGMACQIVAVLKAGQAVGLEELQRGWGRVTAADGQRRGWVALRYLSKTPPAGSQPVRAVQPPPPLPREQMAPAVPSANQPPLVQEQMAPAAPAAGQPPQVSEEFSR